ncbi:hypothetical protein [Microbacterium capsulatum]|uniref:Uncharacterized protein n=1 Tax=Microbacterium capsulatum TaxID=3041921 RepID=A0ABU0XBS3_9MICO|nr:hypothetical protein [Microbacterium sp. ASV81]MDQ4212558.1 hypothetical protein [Microbacterium sp. ASV81]
MNELFRFLVMRPADLPADTDVHTLSAHAVDTGAGAPALRRSAKAFLQSDAVVRSVTDDPLGVAARAVAAALGADPRSNADAAAAIQSATGSSATSLATGSGFTPYRQRVEDTLIAAKALSDSSGTDARALALVAQGLDAIARTAAGDAEIALRPLVMPVALPTPDGTRPTPEPPSTGQGGTEPPPDETRTRAEIDRLDRAIAALKGVPATGFAAETRVIPSRPQARPARATADTAERARATTSRTGGESSGSITPRIPWALDAAAIQGLPATVRSTLRALALDVANTPLPVMLRTLDDQRGALLATLKVPISEVAAVSLVGSALVQASGAADLVGSPAAGMPTGHGSIRPVGVGDLLLVKEHVLRYEGGELAHVENVLKSEHLDRETRRLERTETTILTEQETTKEEERDTQSTDRFSLSRETSSTIKDDTQFKAGLSVDAKYGPFVEVKANADFATNHSSEESTKQASEFSKDVVARSVSKVVDRVLERRTTTTLEEFEETYSHGFDNSAGTGNISGVYQWVDKVLQAQVYNYGKRMLFDVTLPEPGTAFIVAQTKGKLEGQTFTAPVPFTLTPTQVTEGNYAFWAHQYDVTGIEAPPPPVKTFSKAFDGTVPQDPYEFSKSADIAIDDGYQAKYALWTAAWNVYGGAEWYLLIGNNALDVFTDATYIDMAGEVGSVSVATFGWKLRDFAATVEIFCERTARAMTAWQLKTHAALTQGYLAKQQAYQSQLDEAAAAAGVVISGQNPMWNSRIVTTELRKQCLTLLTAQQFDAFGALETSAEGYPQPALARSEQQMPYVRFFEQAFEWEHIVYFFYPYFWGWKPAWSHRMLLDDVDTEFADFLRAGAGRVVFPVRPGFEAAVVHYLETGEIWNGGPAPDISSSLYVPIVKEIQEATGAPGDEVPVGDPWLVRLPTTLAKLRPDDALPTWTKVGEEWQPSN